MAKGRKRIYDDHALTDFERNRRRAAKVAAIDAQLDAAINDINWERRTSVKSLLDFINTYCIGSIFDSPPSGKMIQVINELDKSTEMDVPSLVELFRGCGKTCANIALIIYLTVCKGHKYAMIVSQNARSSQSIIKEISRFLTEPETDFSRDFPEIFVPFSLGGNGRKLQTYNCIDTSIEKNASQIVLPRIVYKDGKEAPSSQACIAARPITSVRGSRSSSGERVSVVLCDDLQTAETASNPESVAKILDLLQKDVLNLSGQGKKLKLILTATPICSEDLCEQLEHNINWRTIKYKAIQKFPTDIIKNPDDGLWHEYFAIYDKETIKGIPHKESLDYYKSHFDEMNAGSEVFNNVFSESDGHISALQKFLEKQHLIGKSAFECEYQMSPIKSKFAVEITPNIISQKINNYQILQIPDEYKYITYGIDINASYAITVVGIAYKVDTTGIVFFHKVFPCHIDQKLTDASYNQALDEKLRSVCDELRSLPVKPTAVSIDCGGRQWAAVTNFCRYYSSFWPVCAFAGRSSGQFAAVAYGRTRLKDSIGHTVLCGDQQEQKYSGMGKKYVYFDADWAKMVTQTAFNCQLGDIGSLSLWRDVAEVHSDFCIQVSNERIVSIQHRPNGLDYYIWKSKEQHDYLDCCAMCRAALSQIGVTADNVSQKSLRQIKIAQLRHRKSRYKIV